MCARLEILAPFYYNVTNEQPETPGGKGNVQARLKILTVARLIDKVRVLLREGGALDNLAGFSERELKRTLNMLIHDPQEMVRQRACRELGQMVGRMDASRIDTFIQRLMWRLNPESGDYPVGVPELLGEIGNRAPQQVKNLVSAILYYLDDERLRPGLLQAAGRIGEKLPEVLFHHVDEIARYLPDKDGSTSGNAALALCRIGGSKAREALQGIKNDDREIVLFCGGRLLKKKLREFAEGSYERTDDLCFVMAER